jgi:hypothetical protein
MKKVMRFASPLLKLAIFILFLNNIGIFSIDFPESGPAPPAKTEEEVMKDMQYLKEKLEEAQSLGRDYTPVLYFNDLTDIVLKEKNNELSRQALVSANHYKHNLCNIFHDNLSYYRGHKSDSEYRALMKELDTARDEHLITVDPEMVKKSKENEAKMNASGYWKGVLMNFLVWLKSFYLENILLALLLLWLWWYKEKNSFKINNPANFLLCLVFYPVVIPLVWKKKLNERGRMFAMKIELKRRQADIFSLISENELDDLKRFARSNLKISDYRKYLDNRGFYRQQALTPLLILVAVLTIVKSQANDVPDEKNLFDLKCCYEINAPPTNDVESDFDFNEELKDSNLVARTCFNFIFHFISIEKVIIFFRLIFSSGFQNNPEPIPIVSLIISKQKIINFKTIKNEKYYNNLIYYHLNPYH